jgi:hypothetical protein
MVSLGSSNWAVLPGGIENSLKLWKRLVALGVRGWPLMRSRFGSGVMVVVVVPSGMIWAIVGWVRARVVRVRRATMRGGMGMV